MRIARWIGETSWGPVGAATGSASSDAAIHEDLHVPLNLNNVRLVRARQRVLDVLLQKLKDAQGGFWPPRMIEGELSRWKVLDKAGRYPEYCQVAIYWLEKKLRTRKSR